MAYTAFRGVNYTFGGSGAVPQNTLDLDTNYGYLQVGDSLTVWHFPKSTGAETITNVRIHISYYTTGTWINDSFLLKAVDKNGVISTQTYTFVAGDFGGSSGNNKTISLVLTSASWRDWDVIDARLQVQSSAATVKGADGVILYIDAMWVEIEYVPTLQRLVKLNNSFRGNMQMIDDTTFSVEFFDYVGWKTNASSNFYKMRGLLAFDTSALARRCVIKTARLYSTLYADTSTVADFDTWVFQYNFATVPTITDWNATTGFDTSSAEYEGIILNTLGAVVGTGYPSAGLDIAPSWIKKTGASIFGDTMFVVKSSKEGDANGAGASLNEYVTLDYSQPKSILVVEFVYPGLIIDDGVKQLIIDGGVKKKIYD